jgi:hypothetical protein
MGYALHIARVIYFVHREGVRHLFKGVFAGSFVAIAPVVAREIAAVFRRNSPTRKLFASVQLRDYCGGYMYPSKSCVLVYVFYLAQFAGSGCREKKRVTASFCRRLAGRTGWV